MNDDYLQGFVEGLAAQPLYVGEAVKRLSEFITVKLSGTFCGVTQQFIDDETGV